MTSFARATTIVLLAAFAAVPAAAQDALSKRVSLDLKAMAPVDAFKVLADAVGMTVTVDPAVTAPVDIVVRNVKARTALDTICDSIDCRWTAAGQTLGIKPAKAMMGAASAAARGTEGERAIDALQRTFKAPLPADLKFENAPLSAVAERLSQATGLEVRFGTFVDKKFTETVGGTITADFGGKSLQSALQVVAEQAAPGVVCRVGTGLGKDGRPAVMIFSRGWRKKDAK